MPLTKSGKKVLKSMQETYGKEPGKNIFYASIVKGKGGSTKWHKKGSGKLAKAVKSHKKGKKGR